MKAFKVCAGIAFAVGLIMAFGAIGADDVHELVLHESHELAIGQICIGLLLMIPLPMACWLAERWNDLQ